MTEPLASEGNFPTNEDFFQCDYADLKKIVSESLEVAERDYRSGYFWILFVQAKSIPAYRQAGARRVGGLCSFAQMGWHTDARQGVSLIFS